MTTKEGQLFKELSEFRNMFCDFIESLDYHAEFPDEEECMGVEYKVYSSARELANSILERRGLDFRVMSHDMNEYYLKAL